MKVSSRATTIGIDLMGSDTSPELLLKAAKRFTTRAKIIAFGSKDFCPNKKDFPQNFTYQVCSSFITMDDPPLKAVREKRDSSLVEGLKFLKDGKIDAFVSAGNTGALLFAAKRLLPSLPNIERPALATIIPTLSSDFLLIDAGANASCKKENLIQFATLGAALQKVRRCKNPKVALLNIGSEGTKGPELLRQVYEELLKSKDFHFIGNMEGRDPFIKPLDVLVTDGFSGNIFLKTAEGVATFIIECLSLLGFSSLIIKKLKKNLFNISTALLCGVDGIILKCHGNTTYNNISSALNNALELSYSNFLINLKEEMHLCP